MKLINGIIFLTFLLINYSYTKENRSEIEIKNGVFLEDIKDIGSFKEINNAPKGMFKSRDDDFVKMSKYSR